MSVASSRALFRALSGHYSTQAMHPDQSMIAFSCMMPLAIWIVDDPTCALFHNVGVRAQMSHSGTWQLTIKGKSLHYFNLYAALDRVDFSRLSTETVAHSPDDIMAIPTWTILPTANYCANLHSNYIVLVARTIAERLLHFQVSEYLHAKHLSQSLSSNVQEVENGVFH